MRSSNQRYTFILLCPICYRKEKITVYRSEIEANEDKLKTVLIVHRDVNPPHEIKITIDQNGNIRSIHTKILDRLEVTPMKYSVALKIFPIVINSEAIKSTKDPFAKRILELSDGFHTIDDIAKELNVTRYEVINKIGELRREGKIDLTYTLYLSSEEVSL